jgi:hypothetical protein
MIINIPTDVKTFAMSGSTAWLDHDGIFYSVPNEGAPPQQSIDEIKKEMNALRKIIGDKKVCMILESNSKATSPPKEQRDFIADEINSVAKAIAIISSSPLSRMVANLFFSFKPPEYPYKMFSNVSEAKAWIKQYL